MSTTEKFDVWAVVELFGHTKIAGKCTEQNIAGTNMLRVDVPETEGQPAFTRFLGSSAIYAINPVDELTAKTVASRIEAKPIDAYTMAAVIKKQQATLPAAVTQEEEEEENNDHFEFHR